MGKFMLAVAYNGIKKYMYMYIYKYIYVYLERARARERERVREGGRKWRRKHTHNCHPQVFHFKLKFITELPNFCICYALKWHRASCPCVHQPP